MNKDLVKSIVFTVAFIASVLSIEKAIDYVYNNKTTVKINLLLEHKIDKDVMIWGSSVAMAHIDPKVIQQYTALSAYNMGWPGVFFVQYNSMIKEYLTYQKKCKCMIIACDFDNLGKNQLITRPDLFVSHLSNDYVYESLHDIEPDKMFKAKYVPGYKLGLLSKGFYNTLFTRQISIDTNNGFEPQNATWNVTSKNNISFNARYDSAIYSKLKETLTLVTAKNIEVFLVITPVYCKGYQLISNAQAIKDKYLELTQLTDKIHLLDYTTDTMCLRQDYFYNNSHMNLYGAHRFSQKLGADVNKILQPQK